MPSFDSPIGKKTYQNPNFRQVDVPDESENTLDVDQAINSGRLKQLNPEEIAAFAARANFNSSTNEIPEEINEGFQDAHMLRDFKDKRAAREALKRGQDTLSEGARRRVELLIGMTREQRIVKVNEITFVLQTLKSKEMREALMAASEFDRTVQSPFEIRRQLLARSLVAIDNTDIKLFVGSNKLQAVLDFLEEMDHELLIRLYDEYLILVSDTKKIYAVPKTESEAKEAVEDLKK